MFYGSEPESVPGLISTQLTLDIPNDVFPAFANVNMPTVQSLVVSSPTQGQSSTLPTNSPWTLGTNVDAYISITGTILGTTSTTTIVEREAADNGQFAFPKPTQSSMGASFP